MESPKEKAKLLVSVGKVSGLCCVVHSKAVTRRIQLNCRSKEAKLYKTKLFVCVLWNHARMSFQKWTKSENQNKTHICIINLEALLQPRTFDRVHKCSQPGSQAVLASSAGNVQLCLLPLLVFVFCQNLPDTFQTDRCRCVTNVASQCSTLSVEQQFWLQFYFFLDC